MEQKILVKHLKVGAGTYTAIPEHGIGKEFEITIPDGWNVKQFQMAPIVKDNSTRNITLAMLLEKE